MNKYQRAFIPTLIFFFTIILVLFIRQLDSEDKATLFTKLINYEMPAFWRLNNTQSQKSLQDQKELLVNTTRKITRDELGRNSWQFLHMMSGTMPDNFTDEFQAKTILFLTLYAQYYPCKKCGSHFLNHLKDHPYKGNTKASFMNYVCFVHNLVNKDIGKEEYDCTNVEKEWASCGCGAS